MKITITPETAEEKKKFLDKGLDEIIYTNVLEYFFFGNRVDSDDSVMDIHEWHGGYRYLLGSLQYFYEIVNDMRKDTLGSSGRGSSGNVQRSKVDLKLVQPPQPMIKRGRTPANDIKILDQGAYQFQNKDDTDPLDENQNITLLHPDPPNFGAGGENGLGKIDMPNPENIKRAMDKIKLDLGAEIIETKEKE